MSDTGATDTSSGHGAGQGRDAAAAGSGGDDATLTEGERMARKLVRDVAAYEVDPPPPSRVEDTARQSGEDASQP